MAKYPPGFIGERKEEWVMLTCPKCRAVWQAKLVFSRGRWIFEDGRACPECGTEGSYE